jgi:hypothetical protein
MKAKQGSVRAKSVFMVRAFYGSSGLPSGE